MVLTALLLRAIAHSDLLWVNYDPSNNAPSRPSPNPALAVVRLTPIADRTYALKRNLLVLSVSREAESLILTLLSWLSA